MKKRVISLMLVLALCLGLCIPAMAEGEEPVIPEEATGDGTESDPRTVYTTEQLTAEIDKINAMDSGSYYLHLEFIMLKDIEYDEDDIPVSPAVYSSIAFSKSLIVKNGMTLHFSTSIGATITLGDGVETGIINNGILNIEENSYNLPAMINNGTMEINPSIITHLENNGHITFLGSRSYTINEFINSAEATITGPTKRFSLNVKDLTLAGTTELTLDYPHIRGTITLNGNSQLTLLEPTFYNNVSFNLQGTSKLKIDTSGEEENVPLYHTIKEENISCADNATLQIMYGQYRFDPSDYLPEGYKATLDEDGNYTVEKGSSTPSRIPWPELDPTESMDGFNGSVTVTMTVPAGVPQGAEIYYTIVPYTTTNPEDGFSWRNATKYTGPVTLRQSGTVVAQIVVNAGSITAIPQEGEIFWRGYIVNPTSSGNSGSSSSSDDDDTTTSIKTNPNGSTTTTVTDSRTGTVTETTRDKDGTRTVKETKKDGTVTTTKTQPDGTVSKITEANGDYKADITVKKAEDDTMTLPVHVPVNATVTVSGQGDDKRVVIPVTGMTAGTVAVVDGKVVPTAVTTSAGLSLPLADGATVQFRENTKTFSDVANTFWGNDAVTFVTSRELFNGTGGGAFSPNATMTRQMLMTVLARLDGADTSGSAYEKGMAWATNAGISDGRDPESSVSREQLAVMLYRYADTLGLDRAAQDDLSKFSDSEKTSSWAQDAMRWAVGEGLIGGKGNGIVDPAGTATRAEVAAILQRMVTLMAK